MTRPIRNEKIRKVFEKDTKSERITLRVSPVDKAGVRKAARSVGRGMSGYLLKLHKFAVSDEKG